MEPGDVFKNADGFIAVKTHPSVTAGQWFIYHPKHGGGYQESLPGDSEAWVKGTFPDTPGQPPE